MPSYLIERYVPANAPAAGIGAIAMTGVRHLHMTYLPEDETCFDVVEADSRDAVRDALERAAIAYERIVEAVE